LRERSACPVFSLLLLLLLLLLLGTRRPGRRLLAGLAAWLPGWVGGYSMHACMHACQHRSGLDGPPCGRRKGVSGRHAEGVCMLWFVRACVRAWLRNIVRGPGVDLLGSLTARRGEESLMPVGRSMFEDGIGSGLWSLGCVAAGTSPGSRHVFLCTAMEMELKERVQIAEYNPKGTPGHARSRHERVMCRLVPIS